MAFPDFLQFPLKSQACTDPSNGYYYEKYFFRDNPNPGAHAGMVYLGRSAIGGEQALDIAEHDLVEAYACRQSNLPAVLPAAVAVLRLCMQHENDGPTIEVVQNTIANPHDDKVRIKGSDQGGASHGFGRTYTSRMHLIRTDLHYRSPGYVNPKSDVIDYMPHEDFDALRRDHDGIVVSRGGRADPITFGLLGDEKLIAVKPVSNSRFID